MNRRAVIRVTGTVILMEALFMFLPLIVALIDNGSDIKAFGISIVILAAVGIPMMMISPEGSVRPRDGFAAVGISWVAISLLGALPFYLSGTIPSYVDAIFETVSGFTTTGASIMTAIESMPRGILMWRSATHWLGGMGVLVLTLALLPRMGGNSVFLMRAESPGPRPDKLVPNIAKSAKLLYLIYAAMTAVEVILLMLAGMPLYDSLIHAFGTAGTGGFSSKNLSVGAYNSWMVDLIISVFMFLFGINFSMHYLMLKGDFKSVFKNEELRLYFTVVIGAILLISLDIMHLYGNSFIEALRFASFQTSSIITTTGYATADFNLWPMFSKMILIVLMIMGACSGSTGGGVKQIRVLLMLKTIRREMKQIVHPRSVNKIKVDGKSVEENIVASTGVFLFAYFLVSIVASMIIAIDNFDVSTTVTSVLACISNIGPGLELVGPMGNYSMFSPLSKLVLSFCMLIGRLEVLPLLTLIAGGVWRKE